MTKAKRTLDIQVDANADWMHSLYDDWEKGDTERGGEGSGFKDHKGIPGQVGGSLPSGLRDAPELGVKMLYAVSDEAMAVSVRGETGDVRLAEICRQQGFDAKPTMGTKEDLKSEVARGGQEMWRGFSEVSYAQQFTDGEYHVGVGGSGSGTYCSTDKGTASQYGANLEGGGRFEADERSVLHMVLKADAKTISSYDLFMEAGRQRHDVVKWAFDSAAEHEKVGDQEGALRQHEYGKQMYNRMQDQNYVAAQLGYDAVVLPNDFRIVLNRGALLVEQK